MSAATASIVGMNRRNPPDAILREIYLRTGDQPFQNIAEVISEGELKALSDGYKHVTGQTGIRSPRNKGTPAPQPTLGYSALQDPWRERRGRKECEA